MAIKVTKSLAVSGLPSGTWKIIDGQPEPGEKCPAIDASTLSDARKVKVPGPQPEDSPVRFKLAQDAQGKPATGAACTVVLTSTFTDGSTRAISVKGSLTSVEPGTIAVGGDRIPSWDVEFQPDGETATSTSTTATTTTTTPA
ncbi:MAG: hypothetical protein WCG26_00170 [Chloroflexales bacterium]